MKRNIAAKRQVCYKISKLILRKTGTCRIHRNDLPLSAEYAVGIYFDVFFDFGLFVLEISSAGFRLTEIFSIR
jgi:hypothetical protein